MGWTRLLLFVADGDVKHPASDTIYEMEKVSEMLIAVSGDLLQAPDNLEEMQAHLDLARHAWNMSLLPDQKAKYELKAFIKKQKKYAPNIEALKGLELEYRRIIKQRKVLYPEATRKIEVAQAIESSKDNYIIRAYHSRSNC